MKSNETKIEKKELKKNDIQRKFIVVRLQVNGDEGVGYKFDPEKLK